MLKRLEKLADWPAFALLLIVFAVAQYGFHLRNTKLGEYAHKQVTRTTTETSNTDRKSPEEKKWYEPVTVVTKSIETPDGQFSWYCPEQINKFAANIGPDGRSLYVVTELTLDMVFPMVYCGLVAILLFQLTANARHRRLLFVPLVGFAADIGENICAAAVVGSNGGFGLLAFICPILTLTKWTLLVIGLASICFLSCRSLLFTRRVAGVGARNE